MVALINLLNPGLIVIGGGSISAAGKLLLPHVEAAIRERALMRAVNQVRIEASGLTGADWARGAALLIAEMVLQPMFLESLQPPHRKRERRA